MHRDYISENGSVQVVEMSYVLPVAMLVVVSLIYLAFGMFMYVHSFNLAGLTVDELSHSVGKGELYWQLTENFLLDETKDGLVANLQEELNGIAVFPGMKFLAQGDVVVVDGKPLVTVYISCFYLGEKMYSVQANRVVYTPVEYVNSVDILSKYNFEDMEEIYHEFF